MSKKRADFPAPQDPKGMALIEMVVAMAIAVFLLGVAFHFFDDLESMTESVSVMSEVNESLRASADLITRDLYAAGTSVPIGGIPIPNGSGATQVKRPGPGSTYFPATNGVISAITPGYGLSGNIGGKESDEVTISKVDENWVGLSPLQISSMTSSASTGYTVNVTIPPSCTPTPTVSCTLSTGGFYNVNKGDLLMFSTPGGLAALGLVTQDPSGNVLSFGADSLGLNQVCAPSCGGSIDSLQQSGAYPSGMTLTKIDMITYYVDNSNADHPYTLMRLLGASSTANAVAYGINNMYVSYDLSTGQSDIHDPNPTQPNQIRKVNLTLSGISDHTLRRTKQYYSSTLTTAVTIRNLEYVNQFPP